MVIKAIVFLLLIFQFGAASARTLSMVSSEWPPFLGEGLKQQGLLVAITREVFALTRYQVDMSFAEWHQAVEQGKSGEHDIVVGAYLYADREPFFIYSDPIYHEQACFHVISASTLVSYDSVLDLKMFRIGYLKSAFVSDEFHQTFELDTWESDTVEQGVSGLLTGQVDIYASSVPVFHYTAEYLGYSRDHYRCLRPGLGTKQLRLMISRKTPGAERIIREFNRALKALRDSGRYEQILNDMGAW